jgi:hypothetical protein
LDICSVELAVVLVLIVAGLVAKVAEHLSRPVR